MAKHYPEESEFLKKFLDEVYKNGSQETYDKYSSEYDKLMILIDYPTKIFLKLLEEIKIIENETFLEGKSLIDVGCGTGIIGELLKAHVTNLGTLDGLDISNEMLEVCRKKNIYNRLIHAPLTAQPTNGIVENQYDVAVSVGCFVEGHIQMNGLFEMIRMTKPGGYVVFTLYDPNYTKDYMAVMGEVIKSKTAELITMRLTPNRLAPNSTQYVCAYYVIFKVL